MRHLSAANSISMFMQAWEEDGRIPDVRRVQIHVHLQFHGVQLALRVEKD